MITTERNVFIGAHVTKPQKEAVRLEALRQGISMSQWVSDMIDKNLDVKSLGSNPNEVRLPLEDEK